MLQLLVIGCGGAVGALMRYGLGLRITLLTGSAFPWGTLFVNIDLYVSISIKNISISLSLGSNTYTLKRFVKKWTPDWIAGGIYHIFGVFHGHHCSVRSGFVVAWFVVHCYKRDRISTRCIPGNECRTELFIVKP